MILDIVINGHLHEIFFRDQDAARLIALCGANVAALLHLVDDLGGSSVADLQLTLSTKDGDVYVSDIKKVAVRKKYPEDII